jgi:hypothetical protein
VLTNFSRIYLGGIPPIITNDSAFLAFICIVTATEALCGYRNGKQYDVGNMGSLFKTFVSDYFPDPYGKYADDLWTLRNKLIHAFSAGRFLLTHHNSQSHFETYGPKVAAPESAHSRGLFAMTSAPQYMSATGSMVQPRMLADGVILNAEDFYAGLLSAAQRYFSEVRQSADLQTILRERIESEKGGAIVIHEIELGGRGLL